MECPVCFEIFDTPLLLPGCGHTICKACAEALITEGKGSVPLKLKEARDVLLLLLKTNNNFGLISDSKIKKLPWFYLSHQF